MVSANQAWNLVNFRGGLIRALVADGYRVIAVVPADPEWVPRLEAMGCGVESLTLDASGLSPLRDLRSLAALIRLMRRHRPAAWLSWTIKPNLYGSLAARTTGAVALPNVSGLGTVFIKRSALTVLASWLYRFAFRRCLAVFFQNHDDRDLFVRLGLASARQARLLPGSGIDPDRFTPPGGGRPARGRFVMISRLLADKGVREYVESARALRREMPDARFELIGPLGVANRTAIGRAELERWVDEGVILYRPPLDDVRPAIAAADWVVLPSYREGMSRVLLEAAAMGRPIVTTDVPGCRDIVSDGENGFLAAPRDVGSLTDALRRAARCDDAAWRRMAQSGRRRAVESFSEQNVIAIYLSTLIEGGIIPRRET